ncbi:hypothetical protein XELAEV_18002373mg [Xenopus laevis]|nr:hypothetical protein XELAEV_18002373mg [Xenopus laevis]
MPPIPPHRRSTAPGPQAPHSCTLLELDAAGYDRRKTSHALCMSLTLCVPDHSCTHRTCESGWQELVSELAVFHYTLCAPCNDPLPQPPQNSAPTHRDSQGRRFGVG